MIFDLFLGVKVVGGAVFSDGTSPNFVWPQTVLLCDASMVEKQKSSTVPGFANIVWREEKNEIELIFSN